LDEDVIPDFDAAGLEEFTPLRPSTSSSEGSRLKWISEHGPQGSVSPIIQKLSFLLPWTMWMGGIEAFFAEDLGPDVVGLLVKLGGVALGFVGRVDGGVEALGGNARDLGDEFAAPGEESFSKQSPKDQLPNISKSV